VPRRWHKTAPYEVTGFIAAGQMLEAVSNHTGALGDRRCCPKFLPRNKAAAFSAQPLQGIATRRVLRTFLEQQSNGCTIRDT